MKLKTFITKVLKEEIALLEDYSESFSFDALNACETLEDAEEYAKTHLERVGQGLFRTAYGLDDSTVLKVLRTDGDGVDYMQNAQEARNSSCLPKKYVAQVLNKHPEFWWIVVERVTPLSIDKFVGEIEARLGPIPVARAYNAAEPASTLDSLDEKENAFMMAVEYAVDSPSSSSPYNIKQWMNNKWYRGLIQAIRKCQVEAHDFHHKNWGIRPGTNELVLLDLGF